MVVAKDEGASGMGSYCFMGTVSIRKDENTSGHGFTTLLMYQMQLNYTLQNGRNSKFHVTYILS